MLRTTSFLSLAWLLVLGSEAVAENPPAVKWNDEGNYAWRALPVQENAKAGFTRLGAEIGVNFSNLLGTNRYATNQNILNGSGVTVGDVNGDQWPDIFFAGLDSSNALYLNQGNWRFRDGTE